MKTWLAALAALVLAVPTLSLAAQSYTAFAPRPSAAFAAPAFGDNDISSLLATLDRLLKAAPAGPAGRESSSDALWQFARRVQAGRLSTAQEARVLAHLDGIARSSSAAAAMIRGPRKMIVSLSVGKVAPELSGRDLDGRPFKLTEYRNKVVLLVFSAEWCAICRAQAPYQRFLLDKYARWPFAILGVETGSSREAARQTHAAGPLSHRSWWDEPRTGETSGQIAAAWNVVGWPASFVIDGDGVIQFVDLREEDLLIAVRQLVEAQADRDAKAPRAR